MAIFGMELELHDQVFALVEHFVHFLDTFDSLNFTDEIIQLLLNSRFKSDRVFTHLEWN